MLAGHANVLQDMLMLAGHLNVLQDMHVCLPFGRVLSFVLQGTKGLIELAGEEAKRNPSLAQGLAAAEQVCVCV